jgi:hypothetical protein
MGKRVIEKARHALPFTPGFLKMAVGLADDQTCIEFFPGTLSSKTAKISVRPVYLPASPRSSQVFKRHPLSPKATTVPTCCGGAGGSEIT